jgi:uracil-DNA glycosylase
MGISTLRYILDTIPPPYYPPKKYVLRAFRSLSPEEVRVVILGQDPYPQCSKASGLSFGLSRTYLRRRGKINSSIANIQNELKLEGWVLPDSELHLESWVNQGVLLVNTALTVAPDQPMSHRKYWNDAVAQVLSLNLDLDRVVFLCWGAEARDIVRTLGARYVINTSHPCKFSHMRSTEGLSAFTGSQCFNMVNKLMRDIYLNNYKQIQWGLKS